MFDADYIRCSFETVTELKTNKMKTTKLNLRMSEKTGSIPVTMMNRVREITLFLCFSTLILAACSKNETESQNGVAASDKNEASVSAQPLPGGKKNFSVAIGRFATSGATWVRMVNWTFNSSAGTIAATFWQWDSTQEKGKTLFNSHTCTFDGVTKSCPTYTPTGWLNPSGQYTGWTGTYTYNTSTGALVITWSSGHTENWTITNPQSNIARAEFVSSGGTGYAVTHGHGYGSNAAWTTYKTIAQIPKVSYSGYYVLALNTGGSTTTLIPSTATSGAWQPSVLNLSGFTYPSSPSPANALHRWVPGGTACGSGATSRTGIVYHLSSNNNGRSMVWSHFCATLAPDGMWPCYTGQRHPYAFQQIIDDTEAMRGFIGIEQQDEPGSPGYQYQLKDYTTVPW